MSQEVKAGSTQKVTGWGSGSRKAPPPKGLYKILGTLGWSAPNAWGRDFRVIKGIEGLWGEGVVAQNQIITSDLAGTMLGKQHYEPK